MQCKNCGKPADQHNAKSRACPGGGAKAKRTDGRGSTRRSGLKNTSNAHTNTAKNARKRARALVRHVAVNCHRNPLVFTRSLHRKYSDSKNTMQINTLAPTVQGFDSLHPLHVTPRKYTVFLSEGRSDKPTAGRGIAYKFTKFSRIFCGVAA